MPTKIRRLTRLAGLLALFFALRPAAPARAQEAELEGELQVAVIDRQNSEKKLYSLLLAGGGRVELVFSDPDKAPRLPSGTRVRVRGRRSGARMLVASEDPLSVGSTVRAQALVPEKQIGQRS